MNLKLATKNKNVYGKKLNQNRNLHYSNYKLIYFIKNNLYFKYNIIVNIVKYKFNNYLFFIFNSYGFFFFFRGISGLFFGDIILNNFLFFDCFKLFKLGSFCILFFFNKFTYISNVFILNKINYARSMGTFLQIEQIDFELKLLFLKLPSSKLIVINFFVYGFLGRNVGYNKKFLTISKAGFNSLFFCKKNVRGVAKNPVDHPHGGRTKTSSPEVSPWG